MGVSARNFDDRFWAIIAATFWVSSGLEPYFRFSPHTYVTSWGARTRPSDLSLAHSPSSHCLAGFSPARSRTDAAEKSRLLPVCSVAGRLAWRIYSLSEIAGAFLGRALQGFGEACLYTGARPGS